MGKGDVKFLGMNIDNELKIGQHVLKICSTAGRKSSDLARISKLISFRKQKALFKKFNECQFKYCPSSY